MTVSCLASCGSSCLLCSQKHWSQLWSEEKTSQCRSWLPRAGSCPIWRLAVLCRANVLIQSAESIQSTNKCRQATKEKVQKRTAAQGQCCRELEPSAQTRSRNSIHGILHKKSFATEWQVREANHMPNAVTIWCTLESKSGIQLGIHRL